MRFSAALAFLAIAAASPAAGSESGAPFGTAPVFRPALTGSLEAADMVSGEVFSMDGARELRVPRAVLRDAFPSMAHAGGARELAGLYGRDGLAFSDAVPAPVKRQMLDDLRFVGSIRGTGGSRLHQKIFGAVNGSDYADYFKARVKTVAFGRCPPNAVACVYTFPTTSSIMRVTENYVKFKHPQIARLMIVFHEARHTEPENNHWRHVRCPDPFLDETGREILSIWTKLPLAGEKGCDDTPLGSYSSTVVMLKNISKHCANCTDKVRMDAGFYADDQFKRVIDPAAREEIRRDID